MSCEMKNRKYQEEVLQILDQDVRELLQNRCLVITGARGLIGSELIDAVMAGNQQFSLNCKVYAVVRNRRKAEERFQDYLKDKCFQLIQADINKDEICLEGPIDYCIHAASNTHPVYYATKPIETILTNTLGTNRVLQFAARHQCKRFLFLSSVEIYGENRGDTEAFDEKDLGYLDCNTLRAGYPEGKRLGEALCQAYGREKELDFVIARIARCYGPGILEEDSKALSQFLRKGLQREDIVLKSEGKQFYSYVYSADAVHALFFLLAHGKTGEAYNVSGRESDISLGELAQIIAEYAGTGVKYEVPEQTERDGYSTATKAILNTRKLEQLGFRPQYTIKEGISRIMEMKGAQDR